MRYNVFDHSLLNSAINQDWYLEEETRRKNAEDKKRQEMLKKEKREFISNAVEPQKILQNMPDNQRKNFLALAKEEISIANNQMRLDMQWQLEEQKRTRILKDKSWAIQSMWDDGYAHRWNQQSLLLHERRKMNCLRLYKNL